MDVRFGDVVFHRGKGFVSSVIRGVTANSFSHVSIVTRTEGQPGERRFWIMDVLPQRVVNPIEYHGADHAWIVRTPRFPETCRDPAWCDVEGYPNARARAHVTRAVEEMHGVLRKRYPFRELLGYLPGLRRTRTGLRLLNATDRMVCSAFVASAWHQIGFRWYDGDGEEISPSWVDPGVAWRQAVRDVWPPVLTKTAYEKRFPA